MFRFSRRQIGFLLLGVTWIATGATGGATLSGHGAETYDTSSSGFNVDDLKARIIASLNE
jgi:hypothetical protein